MLQITRARTVGHRVRLFDEQHLAIGGKWPKTVRDDNFDRVACLAQGGHRRDYRVTKVLGVLFSGPIAFVIQRLLQLFGVATELVSQLRQRSKQFLAFD